MKASPTEMLYVQAKDFEQTIGRVSPVKKDWLDASCETLTPEEQKQLRLIQEMSTYNQVLRYLARTHDTAYGLFTEVQDLNAKYGETIEAHQSDSTLASLNIMLAKKTRARYGCIKKIQNSERLKLLSDFKSSKLN